MKYTTKEYANKFGLDIDEVTKACREGTLKAEKVSGKWVIEVKDDVVLKQDGDSCGSDICTCSSDCEEICDCGDCNPNEDCECCCEETCDCSTDEDCECCCEETCDCSTDEDCECCCEETCDCSTDEDCECCCEETCDCSTDEDCECCCEETCDCDQVGEPDRNCPPEFNPLANVSMDDILDKVANYILEKDLSDLDKFTLESEDTIISITQSSVMVLAKVFERILKTLVQRGDFKQKHVPKCMELFVDTYQSRVDTFKKYKKKVRKFIKKCSFDLVSSSESLEYFLYHFLFTNDSVINTVVYNELIMPVLKKPESDDE